MATVHPNVEFKNISVRPEAESEGDYLKVSLKTSLN